MRLAELAEAYARLEGTSKRLELRDILVRLIQPLKGEELAQVLYLSQGLLRPEYEGVELGVADALARKAVALATSTTEAEIAHALRTSGDLGNTVEDLLQKTHRLETSHPLVVGEVYHQLTQVASASGPRSQDEKVQTIVRLLARSAPQEAKYLVRFLLGKLRLGVREMTILDALATAFTGATKEDRVLVENAFNLCSDLGLVAERLTEGGIDALHKIRLEVGRPIRPMLAERSPNLSDVLDRMEGEAALEYKYDGLRIQAHVPEAGRVRLFSRRLEEIGGQFPDLTAELPRAIRRKPVIVEGECVPVDPETDEIRPFQEVSRRRGRKHNLDRVAEEIPVALFLFDVLLEGTQETFREPFLERRKRLVELVGATDRIRLSEQRRVKNVADATRFFDLAVAAGAEGVLAKSVAEGSFYRPGARGFWWIKYKRDYTQGLADSIDGVVVGAFFGRGRRGGRYGALLLAVYNPELDRYESFCKVGSGFDDAQLAGLPKRLQRFEVGEKPASVVTELEPDQWLRPGLVIEVRGAELSLSPLHRAGTGAIRPEAGFALRFPRFTGRYRDDKGPEEATTTQELLELYRSQVRQATPVAASND